MIDAATVVILVLIAIVVVAIAIKFVVSPPNKTADKPAEPAGSAAPETSEGQD